MLIRPFRPDDWEEFLEMAKAFHWSDAVDHNTPVSHFEKTFARVMTDVPFSEGHIIEEDGKIAGYGLIFINYSNEWGGMMYTWDEIYVKPEFRNRGIGTAYIKEMENSHRDIAAVYRLESEEENTGAVKLYERLGYQRVKYRQMFKFMDETTPNNADTSMIRPFETGDLETWCKYAKAFSNEGCSERPADRTHYEETFRRVLAGDPYVQGYLIYNGPVGGEAVIRPDAPADLSAAGAPVNAELPVIEAARPVGYALVCPTYANEVANDLCFVDEIYLEPAYRGKGLGTAFVNYFEDFYRDRRGAFRFQFPDGEQRAYDYFTKRGYEFLRYFEMHKKV